MSSSAGRTDSTPAGKGGNTVSDQWYYYSDSGETVGPLGSQDLARLLREGALTPDHYVWREGFSDWTALKDVDELAPLLTPSATPPAVPAPPVEQGGAAEGTGGAADLVAAAGPAKKPGDVEKAGSGGMVGDGKRPRKGRWFLAAAGLLVAIAGLAAAGYFGWRYYRDHFAREIPLASLIPAGVRVYTENDYRNLTPEEIQRARKWIPFLKMGKEITVPDPEGLGFRVATALYKIDTARGFMPEMVVVVQWQDPEKAVDLEKQALDALHVNSAKGEEKNGWEVFAGEKSPRGTWHLARRKDYRILSNSKKRFEEALALWKNDNGASFAKTEDYRKYFAGAEKTVQDKSFVDFRKILDDIDPIVGLFGGEAYANFRKKYLNQFGAVVSTGQTEGGTYRFTGSIAVDGNPSWLKNLADASCAFPFDAFNGYSFRTALAFPKGWAKPFETVFEKIETSIGEARLGAARATIGMINGSLAMYFADHTGNYPETKGRVEVGQIAGLIPKYLPDNPRTPWNEPFYYEGNGAVFRIVAKKGADTILVYESETGRIETAPDAEKLLSSGENEVPMSEIVGDIRELGFAFDWGGKTPKDIRVLGALRFEREEMAERFLELGEAGNIQNKKGSEVREGPWLLFQLNAETAANPEKFRGLSPSKDGVFLRYSMTIPFAELGKLAEKTPSKKFGSLPKETWKISMEGKAQEGSVLLTGEVQPNPRGVGLAATLVQWCGLDKNLSAFSEFMKNAGKGGFPPFLGPPLSGKFPSRSRSSSPVPPEPGEPGLKQVIY